VLAYLVRSPKFKPQYQKRKEKEWKKGYCYRSYGVTRLTKDYYKQLSDVIFDKLNEINSFKFFDKYKLPKCIQDEKEYLNSPITKEV
jgi:hypothetical protein